MIDCASRQIVFLVVLLFALCSPAFADYDARPRAVAVILPLPAPIVLGDGWSVGKLVSGGGRTRIVQICAVVMSIALFIMMRKLR